MRNPGPRPHSRGSRNAGAPGETERGIRVNSIGPGATVTPINRSWIEDPGKRAMVEAHIPMRRAGGAAEMAAAVAFLCSGEAAYITGQTLFVDGGLTLYPSFETTWSSE